VKGGAVWANTDYSATVANIGAPVALRGLSTSTNDTRLGALFGVGVEYAFLPNWSAKLEYNFMDFQNQDEDFAFRIPPPVGPPGGAPVTVRTSINEQIHVIKAGLNYRFDWGRM
jgi:outer membrane immunogenic protein